MKWLHAILVVLVSIPVWAATESDEPKPVDDFQVERYLGQWYEIARTPNRFEKNLKAVRAEYSLRDDGKLKVVNSGWSTTKQKWKSAEGKAKFAQSKTLAFLKVSFFWIFYSDYIVFELDPDYQYAFVAGDDSQYLWLLARTKTVSDELKQRFVKAAEKLGASKSELIWVDHSSVPDPR